MRFAYVKICLKIFENIFVQLKRSIFKTLIFTCFCRHNSLLDILKVLLNDSPTHSPSTSTKNQ